MAAKEAQPTQQFVEIEDIKNGVVILKNGGLRRVLMVSGINFDLKSEEEQGVITFSYQKFLNSLDFPLQVVIHSRKLNIDRYLENLGARQEAETSGLLKNQINEYIQFVRSLVEMNEVMAKTFFAIVPYDPVLLAGKKDSILSALGIGKKKSASSENETFEQRITQLDQRTDSVTNGLSQVGLRVVALNDEELIELFYNLYNPRTIEKKDLKIAAQE